MKSPRALGKSIAITSCASLFILLMMTRDGLTQGNQVIAECVASNANPQQGETITVAIHIDMRGVQPPDNRLSAYQAALKWDPTVIQFVSFTRAPAPWNNPSIDSAAVQTGRVEWNDFRAGGVDPANINILNVNFRAIGASGAMTTIDLSISGLQNSLLKDLLGILKVNDCPITIQPVEPPPPTCELEIISPTAHVLICSDSVEVTGVITAIGGTPPFSISCSVNGIVAVVSGSTFTVKVPLSVGENILLANCTVVDGQGNQTACSDTVIVSRSSRPACTVNINSPKNDSLVCAAAVKVTGVIDIVGGQPPFILTCTVNGVNAEVAGSTFTATVPLVTGDNLLIAVCTVVDNCGNESVCSDTIRIARAEPSVITLNLTSPQDGALVCKDTVSVQGVTRVSGGVAPFATACTVNGIPVEVIGNAFAITLILEPGVEFITASCTVTDNCGNQAMSFDTVRVVRSAPPVCTVEISSPLDGAFICGDSITVTGQHTLGGGVAPFTTACFVNNVAAEVLDHTFTATIVLEPGVEFIVAFCTVTDGCGNQAVCQDTIRIARPNAPICEVEITSPHAGAFVCEDSVTVAGLTSISGGVAPVVVACEVNGVPAEVTGNIFTANVPLASGDNLIVATCTVTDGCGQEIVCRDSLRVFRDDIAPTCAFKLNGTVITGIFTDNESGVASFKTIKLKNATLTVNAFDPGDHQVGFRLDAIDKSKPMGFSIDVTDVCGNKFNCDPIMLSLSVDAEIRQHAFSFPSLDRYLQFTNRGLSEIRITLNGKSFKLFTDPNRARQEINAYVIPSQGIVTFDLQPYLRAEAENDILIAFEGPAGAGADFALMDISQSVDYVLELESIPAEFLLAQNYPNPFNPSTNIRFDIPERLSDGVRVQLRIYNVLGEIVRTLVDETRFAGRHVAQWDGRDERGEVVATGIYIYQFVAGHYKETRRMILQK
jgi:hypothetical protein